MPQQRWCSGSEFLGILAATAEAAGLSDEQLQASVSILQQCGNMSSPTVLFILNELRRRGIIVTSVGPYTNFRDPEGRVIKLSEEKTIVA